MKRLLLLAMGGLMLASPSFAADPVPLTLEAKIPLGPVRGRIDHLAVDLERKRLFVAELGNDRVGIVDLDQRRLERRIADLSEPQGLGYVAATDTLYVANGGDGSLRLFAGADLAPAGRIDLGSDADNVRVDAASKRVFVGYGDGALAIVDAAARTKIGATPLKAHPEGFQIDAAANRAFVNLPDDRAIAVLDLAAGKVAATIPVRAARANFPMALDRDRDAVLIVSRAPAKLLVLGVPDGSWRASIDTCGDADDVFVDAKRGRAYVSCGDGFIDVFDLRPAGPEKIARISTAAGARTSLFVPALDRLFLAVRAAGSEAAAVWAFQPQP
jgi:DNA-binding beta-propeller fold protein YncE